MDRLQPPKGKVIALKTSQIAKAKHHSKALYSETNYDAKNSDGGIFEEEEEELALLTKRVQSLL